MQPLPSMLTLLMILFCAPYIECLFPIPLCLLSCMRAHPPSLTVTPQDDHTTAYFMFVSSSRWVGFRLDFLTTLFVIATVFVAALARSSLTPSQVGLSLTYVLQLCAMFQWCVRQVRLLVCGCVCSCAAAFASPRLRLRLRLLVCCRFSFVVSPLPLCLCLFGSVCLSLSRSLSLSLSLSLYLSRSTVFPCFARSGSLIATEHRGGESHDVCRARARVRVAAHRRGSAGACTTFPLSC